MKVFVVYCHPDAESFTCMVKDSFIKGLTDAGHSVEISDLYEMGFDTDFSSQEYRREAYYRTDLDIPSDVREQQEKLDAADAVVFIYPVFWTEAPAKLVGWFQRVWTYGYAYGSGRTMKQLERALFFITMGGSLSDEIRRQQVEAMKTVMLGDRIADRAKNKEMIVFDEMSREYLSDDERKLRISKFLKQAYETGFSIQNKDPAER